MLLMLHSRFSRPERLSKEVAAYDFGTFSPGFRMNHHLFIAEAPIVFISSDLSLETLLTDYADTINRN